MSKNFAGKTAVVTGGTRGIGKAVVSMLASRGATVISFGSETDVRQASAINQAVKSLGPVDILIANAGVFGPVKSVLSYTDEEWGDVLDVNLAGQMRWCRALIPGMVERGYGRVVMMSSAVAKDVNPMAPAYCASKAGVIALAKCLGRELAKTGVTVNAITPAAANTDLFKNTPPEQVQAMLLKTPMNRYITVDEIASLVCWMASADCSATTGAVFDISGGRSQY